MNLNDLEKAKADLYWLLLKKPTSNLTDNEIDIMFYLARDEAIQKVLDEALRIKNGANR
jgi:hypothetical protein